MEIFGAVTGVITLIHLSKELAIYVSAYAKNEKEMPPTLQKLINELNSLIRILSILESQYRSNEQDQSRLHALEVLTRPGCPLDICKDTLKAVKIRLNEYEKKSSMEGFLSGRYKDQKIQEYIKELTETNRVLMLVLSTDQLVLLRATEGYAKLGYEDTQDILKGQEIIIDKMDANFGKLLQDANHKWSKEELKQEEEKRAELLEWVVSVECESNHRAAISLRQEGTGLWFTEGADFEEWESGLRPFLWLYGMAGAGKSILASSIIEKILGIRGQASNDIGIAYFYFDFRVDEKQKTSYMIGSLIKQLLEGLGRFPAEIYAFYERQQQRRHPFDLRDALELLPIIAAKLSRVIFVVDGLDECKERETLLKTISGLLMLKLHNLSLLFTSRDEYDIKVALKALSFLPIPIQTAHVASDIALFVAENMKRDPQLERLPPELKDLIKKRLVEGAKGMFRWVKCQFDQIRNLRRPLDIKIALNSLPPDLDETYERLLVSVTPSYQEIVRRTLQFLSYAARAVTLQEVAEAVVVEVNQTALDPDLRFTKPEELLVLCGSFITEANGFISLAHYSVKEYLTSTRIRESSASSFLVTDSRANLEICQVCLRYLNFRDFAVGPCRTRDEFYSRLASYPFLEYATRQWHKHAKKEGVEVKILDLATNIWSAQANPNYLSWLQTFQRDWDPDVGKGRGALTIYFPALWGLSNLVKRLLEIHAPVNYSGEEGQPLVAAVISGSEEVAQMVIEAGADPNTGDGHKKRPLEVAIKLHRKQIVKMLLLAGADVNDRGGGNSFPLHTAIQCGSEEIIRAVLRAGADVQEILSAFSFIMGLTQLPGTEMPALR